VCVLFVEDEPLIRMIMTESLHEAGFEVADADTGDQAIEIIRHSALKFTALVTDFHMPGAADGYRVAYCMRKAWPRIPVIIASGRPDVFHSGWKQRLGYRLLKKPYTPTELIQVVNVMIARHRPEIIT